LPRILVVDDEIGTRESVADLLRGHGFVVATASDGAEALACLRAQGSEAGLVLLDLEMPESDGWSFRREQLADPAIASIPVVLMSGVHNVRSVAASLGIADFVIKPIELARLLDLVRRYAPS